MIQIKDGNPDTVQLWLAYLRKHQYYGVGMKASVWEFSQAGIKRSIGDHSEGLEKFELLWTQLGQRETIKTSSKVEELLSSRRFKEAVGLQQPLAIARS